MKAEITSQGAFRIIAETKLELCILKGLTKGYKEDPDAFKNCYVQVAVNCIYSKDNLGSFTKVEDD